VRKATTGLELNTGTNMGHKESTKRHTYELGWAKPTKVVFTKSQLKLKYWVMKRKTQGGRSDSLDFGFLFVF